MRLRRTTRDSRVRPDTIPDISIIVIVYDMPQQALNTLYTLSRAYQRDIEDVDYEVVVVENRSRRTLRERKVRALGPEFRYMLRDEQGVSRFGHSARESPRPGAGSSA